MLPSSSHAAATHLALDRFLIVHCFTRTDFKAPLGPLDVAFVGVERIYFGIHVIVQTTFSQHLLASIERIRKTAPKGLLRSQIQPWRSFVILHVQPSFKAFSPTDQARGKGFSPRTSCNEPTSASFPVLSSKSLCSSNSVGDACAEDA